MLKYYSILLIINIGSTVAFNSWGPTRKTVSSPLGYNKMFVTMIVYNWLSIHNPIYAILSFSRHVQIIKEIISCFFINLHILYKSINRANVDNDKWINDINFKILISQHLGNCNETITFIHYPTELATIVNKRSKWEKEGIKLAIWLVHIVRTSWFARK